MALSAVKTWIAAEVLYASDLVAEFANLYNNPISLISPLTGSVDAGGFDITALDEIGFNDADADATAVGRMRRTNQHLEWHDATGSWPMQLVVGGGLFGLTLSNDATDPTNDIGVAAGQAIDDTEIYTLRLASALIKRLDAAWAVGTNAGMLDTGAIANTTYHIFLIKRSDTGVTDVLASTSATAPTMPTSYDFKRRIGSILREGGAIVTFTQDGDYFRRAAGVTDVATTAPGTSAVTATLSVPTGINVHALIAGGFAYASVAGETDARLFFSDLAATDVVATVANAQVGGFNVAASGHGASWGGTIRTNTSRQIRYRSNFSDANYTVTIGTHGWIDRRGRDN